MFDNCEQPSKTKLMTIGYEGSEIDDFVATLKVAGVSTLVDVRELPLSRKKGFSKNRLRERLEDEGIEYIHVRPLGDPKPGRDAARAGRFDEFVKIFNTHMSGDAAQQAIEDVIPVVKSGGACLLCFERCHSQCHRSIVADAIASRVNIELMHIGVKKGIGRQNSTAVG